MSGLYAKAFGGIMFLLFILVAALFLSAWTFDYWQAWAFLGAFFIPSTCITVYLAKKDPALLARRVSAGPAAEKERKQKIIQSVAQIAFMAIIVFPAIDHRFGWSPVPSYISAFGDILVVAGFTVVFLVFKENTFTSATIEVSSGQSVTTKGPYSIVRHPMYSGALILLIGTPLALGSLWGLLAIIPIAAVIVWRLTDEEKFLEQHLTGYSEYRNKVRCRLVPFVW